MTYCVLTYTPLLSYSLLLAYNAPRYAHLREVHRALEFELLPQLCQRWDHRLRGLGELIRERPLPHIEGPVVLQPLEPLEPDLEIHHKERLHRQTQKRTV